jgi:hypothetical protein
LFLGGAFDRDTTSRRKIKKIDIFRFVSLKRRFFIHFFLLRAMNLIDAGRQASQYDDEENEDKKIKSLSFRLLS